MTRAQEHITITSVLPLAPVPGCDGKHLPCGVVVARQPSKESAEHIPKPWTLNTPTPYIGPICFELRRTHILNPKPWTRHPLVERLTYMMSRSHFVACFRVGGANSFSEQQNFMPQLYNALSIQPLAPSQFWILERSQTVLEESWDTITGGLSIPSLGSSPIPFPAAFLLSKGVVQEKLLNSMSGYQKVPWSYKYLVKKHE